MKITDIDETVIKLGKPNNSRAKNFMAEFEAASQEHPFNNRARIFHNTMVEVSVFGAAIHLGDIQSIQPNSGAGTKAMQALLALADKHNVKIEAVAKSYTNDSKFINNTNDLLKWYQKLGFELAYDDNDEDDGYEIIYYPK